MRFREFTPEDFDAIRKVDKLAWTEFSKSKNSLHLRSEANILSNWSEDPHGCFLAEEKDDVVGYVFSHTWGKLGWAGTFGVRPEYRGRGIGKRLLEEAVQYLESRDCTTIGLETRPENPYNVGMYISHGFRAKYLTLWLTLPAHRQNSSSRGVTECSKLGESDQRTMIEQFLLICDSIQSGLDYTKMGKLRILHKEGEIVAFGNLRKKPWGFAVVRTVSQRVGGQYNDAFVETLVVRPGYESKLPLIVRSLESLACKWGKSNLVIPVNTCNPDVAHTLVSKEGFSVRRGMLRLMYREQEMKNDHAVNLSIWIM